LEILIILSLCIVSYLLGSIPTALWVGESYFDLDIREHGSGNSGATNAFRVLGKKAGTMVLLIDVFKGFLAASLVRLLTPDTIILGSVRYVNLQLLFGLICVLGHVFPIFARFKGGKGIATLFGMIIAIHYLSALVCLGIFLFILIATHYVSLSSITTAIAFPLFATLIFRVKEPLFIAFAITASLLVIFTHQKNIKKLINGNENKIKLFNRRV
jgi:glycerol-3-phosphate acyltransferase PlsY